MSPKGALRAALAGVMAISWIARADSSGRIVCWNDEHGMRACGDHVPAEYAQKARQVYDQRGVMIQAIEGAATPEERAAMEQKARAEKAAREQQERDTFLLQSYRSVGDLEAERDSRLASIETRLELAEKSVAEGESVLNDLHSRADEAHTAGNPPDAALAKQIQTFEASHADDVRAVTALQQKRDALAAQYEHDIQRFLVLSNAAPANPQTNPQH
ncbi:MAG: hypothetical protein ISP90_05615 [Nevskia sp.]|nr:hypothetical protein [Nevskia sp.]